MELLLLGNVQAGRAGEVVNISEEKKAQTWIKKGFAIPAKGIAVNGGKPSDNTSINIPFQLRNNDFRFVKIQQGHKNPFEKEWQNKNNYTWTDPKFQQHINNGGNYGVVCGYADLVVIDADIEKVKNAVSRNLPVTFTVKTGSGGYHFYYCCSDLNKPIRLRKPNSNTVGDIGDIQFTGKQVVGPGSIHPNGNKYEVSNDVPIQTVLSTQIKYALQDFIITKDEEVKKEEGEQTKKFSVNIESLNITDIVDISKLKRHGDEYQGAHPVHGSDTGQNFCVNPSKNIWHCFRHGTGGGPLTWIAVQEGIIDCSDAIPGTLRSDAFKKVLKVAKEKYGLESPRKIRKVKKAEEKFDIHQVMQYPDWGLNGKIVNPIVLDKDVEGNRKIYTFKVYIDEDRKLQTEQIGARLFIPPTGMTPSALEAGDVPLPVIYSKFKALMDRHLYFTNDIQYNLQTLAAMSSYFREVFDTYPYIDYFSADIGVGKTHAMLCLIFASFHGFAMVIPTEAVLFRSVEDAHATVGIDEVHKLFKNPGQHQDLLALLLSGHTKGIGTYRMDMNTKPPMLISYDPFGLKAFTRKGPIPIDLLSRSITFHMMNARKRKSIEEHLTPEEFAECRDRLYLYRLKHWQKVQKVYDALRNGKVLEGRQADLFLPLLTMAKLCSDELYSKVLKYAREDETKRFAVKHDERVVVLVEYLKDEEYSGDVKVRDIGVGLQERLLDAGLMKEDRKLTSQTVMGWLSSLGFDKSGKRTDGYVHYTIDTKRLDAWYEDIVIEKEGEETKPTPPIQQTSLSSLNLIQEENVVSSSQNPKMSFNEVNEFSRVVRVEGIKILGDSDGWCEFCCENKASKKIETDNEIQHVCDKCLAELNFEKGDEFPRETQKVLEVSGR